MKKLLLVPLFVFLFGRPAEASPATSASMAAALRRAAMGRILVPGPAGGPAFVGEVTAATCGRDDVNTAINGLGGAVNGDTVYIPMGDCHWASGITISEALKIYGEAGCTLAANEAGVLVPDVCPTNIIKDTAVTLITWNHPVGATYPFANELAEIMFTPGSNTTGSSAIMNIVCSTYGHASLRVFHTLNNGWAGQAYSFNNCRGVVDHNYLDSGEQQTMYFRHTQFYGPANELPAVGSPDNGDASWAQPVELGMPSATQIMNHTYPSVLYVEYNTIKGGSRACWDGTSGGRVVARYNQIYKCTPAHHGTDSTSRERAMRSEEYYRNHYYKDGGAREFQWEVRDGSGVGFQNTSDYSPSIESALLKNYRAAEFFPPWGGADGTNPLDDNDPANPHLTGTATGGSSTTLVDTTQTWTVNQWRGYVIRWLTRNGDGTTLCRSSIFPERACFAPILSSTACNPGTCTLTYQAGDSIVTQANDLYEINKIIRTIDQPGRGGGSKITTNFSCTGFSMSAGVVTANCNNHGFTTVDVDIVIPNIQNSPALCAASPTNGSRDFAVPSIVRSIPNANQFTYNYPYGIDASVTCASSGGNVSKLPAAWNDQEDFPVLTWLNTNAADANAPIEPSTGTTHVLGETYADYTTGMFTGVKGTIGAGLREDRSETCEVGSYYWSEDGGGNWNTVGEDGALDKCTAPDTWDDDWYIPYTNPHPLATSGPTILTIDPDEGDQNETVEDVEITGTNLNGTVETIAVSGTGVTAENFTVTSPTTATVDFNIAPTATVGNRNVTITVDGTESTAGVFTVNGLTITDISPPAGNQGQTVSLTLTGTKFGVGGTCTVAVSGTGITVQSTLCNSETNITTELVIAGGATLGSRNVTVTNGNTTSAPADFTVVANTTPTLTSVTPASGVQGTTVIDVALVGTNLNGANPVVTVSSPNPTVGSGVTAECIVNSAVLATCNFTIVPAASLGPRNVVIQTDGGTSNAVTFTVTAAPVFGSSGGAQLQVR